MFHLIYTQTHLYSYSFMLLLIYTPTHLYSYLFMLLPPHPWLAKRGLLTTKARPYPSTVQARMKNIQSGFYRSRWVRTELQKIKHRVQTPTYAYSYKFILPIFHAPTNLYSNYFMLLSFYTPTISCSYSFMLLLPTPLISQKKSTKTSPYPSTLHARMKIIKSGFY